MNKEIKWIKTGNKEIKNTLRTSKNKIAQVMKCNHLVKRGRITYFNLYVCIYKQEFVCP